MQATMAHGSPYAYFETNRDSVYLPHPIHQEFVDSIQNHISDVIVFDLKK